MHIRDIQIEYAVANELCSRQMDNVCHVKVLPYLSVVQAVEGSYDIALGAEASLSTGQGGFFAAPAHVQQTIVHNADPISGRFVGRWAFLQIKVNGVHYLDELFRFPTVLPPAVEAEMNTVFDALFAADNLVDKHIAYYRILRLLLSVGTENEDPHPSYIGQATSFIRQHYTEKLTVGDIAAQVNLSPSRFYAVFRQQMGISPIAYLNNYRLSLAVERLLESDDTVAAVAASVGIPDAVYFHKVFKKHYRMSPTAYRQMHSPLCGIGRRE